MTTFDTAAELPTVVAKEFVEDAKIWAYFAHKFGDT